MATFEVVLEKTMSLTTIVEVRGCKDEEEAEVKAQQLIDDELFGDFEVKVSNAKGKGKVEWEMSDEDLTVAEVMK